MLQMFRYYRNILRLSFLGLLYLVLFSPLAYTQVSEGGIPYSFAHRLDGAVEQMVMPAVDEARLRAEDKLEESKGVPMRFGFGHDVNLTMSNSGKWEQLPDGSRLWRLRIVCPGATSINLIYSEYLLPEGAKLYLYNDKKSEVIGAFTARNNKEDGKFATGLTRGDAVTLEYFLPAKSTHEGIINISLVVHGYRDIFKEHLFTDDFGTSGSCNINVNCPQGANWQNEKRGVAMIISGIRLCTGMMINNVRQDLTPYFLTANHCIEGENVSTWIFMFKYESPNCEIIDGPLNYTVSGSTIKANNAASDFALLKLNEAVPDTYRVHYMGWSAVDVAASSGACIHHPDGDIKKISFVTQALENDTWSGTPANSHWRAYWSAGVTEPGSSGSPLFDQNHHVVGQLHGGPSSCTSTDKYDKYGKFSMSWNYGSTAATRIKDWLDPDNTGTLTLNGWDLSMGARDTIPPTKVTDLHTTAKLTDGLTIGWTAPMDTSYGGVMRYDLRYSATPITDTITFAAATQVTTGTPKPAGQPESATVTGLTANTIYYFALRAADLWSNWSLLSNVLKDTTYKAPLMVVTPDSIKRVLIPQTIVLDSVIVKNNSIDPSTLDYTAEIINNTFPNKLGLSIIPLKSEFENFKSGLKTDTPQLYFGQSVKAAGGPDSAGYKWIDSDEPNGPQYTWNDISASGTAVTNWIATGTFGAKDEGYAGPIEIGFPFKFYGAAKTQIYISTNGILVFSAPTANIFSNTSIPTAAAPNQYIAPFWDDLDGTSQGTVHYKTDGDKFIVQYTNWGRYYATGTNYTFQIVMYRSGKIMYYYNTMTGTINAATVGIENATGTVGLQIAYDATYVKNNLAVKIAAEPDWLVPSAVSGRLYNGNSAAIQLAFHSEDYPAGSYSADLKITSSDPAHPTKIVPIKMTLNYPTIPLTVLSPNGAENWTAGSAHPITWQANDVTNIDIKYTTNNGSSWLAIASNVSAASGTYSWTVPFTPSQQCKVRINKTGADTVFDASDNAFTISTGAITWQSEITVKDNSTTNSQVLTMGLSPIGTNGIDAALGEEALSAVPPTGTFDARFELPVTPAVFSVKDFRRDTAQSAAWLFRFQPGAAGYPFTISWNPATLPAGNFTLRDVVNGTLIEVNMRTVGSYTLTNTSVTALKIEYTKAATVPMSLAAGWNMVSVPVTAADMTGSVLFSGANSQIFGYDGGYTIQTTLTTGKGYWVRYASAALFNINGTLVSANTVPLLAGWNMIGAYQNAVQVSGITTTPANIINSYFFGYNNGYNQATALEAGKGYWVRATQAGLMNLPSTATAKGNIVEMKPGKDWGRVTITDASRLSGTLYTLPAAEANSALAMELPPVPPAGVFDVRFASNRIAEQINAPQTIQISGAAFPVSLQASGLVVRVIDKATSGKLVNTVIKNGEQLQLTNSAISVLEITSVDNPVSFELSQNYPNPFNPTTTIKYGVPEKANVTLTIYNQLGQKVAQLFSGSLEPGYYTAEWNAANMSSGIYFYELKSDKFTSIKKLILMK